MKEIGMSRYGVPVLLVLVALLSVFIVVDGNRTTISFSQTDKIIVSAAVIRSLNLPPEISKLNIVCPRSKCTPSEIVLVSNVLSGSIEESNSIISEFKEVTGE
jgi:hypothetical protein